MTLISLNKFYNMDCIKGMKKYPDKYFDLAIIDPPYGIDAPNMRMGADAPCRGRTSSTAVILKKNRLNAGYEWDREKPSPGYFKELFRVSKNQIIWGGNYFDLPPTRGIICWDKMQPWENFSQWEMAWTSFDKPAALFKYSTTGASRKEKRIHPTQKPVALYTWLLNSYAKEGDKILDTHVGSASSLIACHILGFDYVGYEIDNEYYTMAKERMEKVKQQLTLFN